MVVSLFFLGTRISLSHYGWPSSGYGSTLSLLTLAGFQGGYYGNHKLRIMFACLIVCFVSCSKERSKMGECCIDRSQPEMSLVWPEQRCLEWPQQRCLVWPQRRCLVWPEMEISCMAGDDCWLWYGLMAFSRISHSYILALCPSLIDGSQAFSCQYFNIVFFIDLQYLPGGSRETFFFGALIIESSVDHFGGREVGCCKIWTTWRQAASFMSRLVGLIN